MRIKKKLLLLGACLFIFIYILLYFLVDRNTVKKNIGEDNNVQISSLRSHQNITSFIKIPSDESGESVCQRMTSSVRSDVQMLNLYKKLKFDNTDGGVWKQGWNVQVTNGRWNAKNKLKVFVVPHSHNDPGWKRTFEQYYESQTRYIFNNMVQKLSEDRRRKFIWAEVSYLSLWWNEASEAKRKKFRDLVNNGQIEIVSGGWVMPDEANSHYYSLVQQLTQGHQWLQEHLNYKPKRSWCIDPFGVSPTMPYILQQFGLKSLVIQRTHYSVKKYLAKHKQLEFRWRQLWDGVGKRDFMTHMMPFYNYDIPHTCGPDPAVCCQFDFKRSAQFGMICPWKRSPQTITEKNVAFRAELLLDQYRKKAELYSTNVLLVPLGDDFRYDMLVEWDLQYQNYQKLFNYMNENQHLFVKAQFGTLEDYFNALMEEKSMDSFPSLTGDFFTYADRDDHYWSGYYTSRPYYKRMDREMISYLRSAEILHSIAWKSAPVAYSKWLLSDSSQLISRLRKARANLSLFQHHDGITGTAKDNVVDDYAQKLQQGMGDTAHVMQQSLNFILHPLKENYQIEPDLIYFELKEPRKTPYADPKLKLIKVSPSVPVRRVVIFNSLSWQRTEIVSLKVEDYKYLEVQDENLRTVPYQISPFCEINDHSGSCHLLLFEVSIKPLEIKTYNVAYAADAFNKENRATLTVMNGDGIRNELESIPGFTKTFSSAAEFAIQNRKMSVVFRPNGLIKAVTLKSQDLTVPVHLNFVHYSCQKRREMCGAYLFLPDGDSRVVKCENPLVKIIEGPLMSSVIVYCDFVIHAVHIYNISGSEQYSVEIQNLVDITTENNFEIAMKLSTSIKNKGTFYTDLNGLQIIKRQFLSKLPLQANYYPMPSSIYIEDDRARVSLVSAQPLGASSLSDGEIEVMQDRRLSQDDNLGLGQGVLDNRPILHIFRLVVEKRIQNCWKMTEAHLAGYLSVISYLAMNSILYPLSVFVQTDVEINQHGLLWSYNVEGINRTSSVDVHIVTMSTIPEVPAVGFVLHRTELDTCFHQEYENFAFSSGLVNVRSFVPTYKNDTIRSASASFIQVHQDPITNTLQKLCPMDVAAFYVSSN